MEKNSPRYLKNSSGYSNPIFTEIFNCSKRDSKSNMGFTSFDEPCSIGKCSDLINDVHIEGLCDSPEDDTRHIRSLCKVPPLENLCLGDKNETPLMTKKDCVSLPKAQTSTLGCKFYELDSDKAVPLSSMSWPLSFVKPNTKKSTSTFLPSSLKFSSRGLSTQTSNFTPLMYRRAISLRGHSGKNEETKGNKSGCTGSIRTILRRSHSEKINKADNPASEEDDGISSKGSPVVSSLKRRENISPSIESKNTKNKTDSENELTETLSIISDDVINSGNVTELIKSNVCNGKRVFHSSEAFSKDLIFLKKTLEEYILSLIELLNIYEKMKALSPEKIRQHFDFPFSIIKKIFNLQCKINRTIIESKGNLSCIAKAFLNDQFITYQQYMILSPSIFSNYHNFKDHFEGNFPSFKSLILIASSKLNFYVQILSNFLKFATPSEKNELNRAISFLKDLKWNANTEMTIKIVKDSPIDLHLGGRILNVGELNYINGPLPRRSYYLIAFENRLVITISKVSYCLFVTHFRSEQILSVECEKNSELTITTVSCNQENGELHQFRGSEKEVNKWFTLFDDWIVDKIASFENVNDSYSCFQKSLSKNNYPLSLWQIFPFLKKSVITNSLSDDCKAIRNIRQLCLLLVEKEVKYIEKLNNIFNPQTLPPPPELKDLLQRILNLHEIYFLPELRQVVKKDVTLAVDIFMNYLLKFSTYKTYLIKRCLCTIHMPDGMRAQYYIAPVQHFAFYIEWSKELGMIDKYREPSAFAVDTLLNFIFDAKVILLHEAIPNSCLDFYKTGELTKGGKMEMRVRPKQKLIKDGSFMILLFEKVLLILKVKSPTYKLIFDLWLYQVNLGPPPGNPNSFKLEFRQGKSKSQVINFEFKTNCPSLKQEWVDQLKEELQAQAEEIKRCSQLKDFL